jgi:cellobiose-specific phosphotransferase system component IIB
MRRSVVLVFGLALAGALAVPLLAQEGEFTHVTWVTVKPGMTAEYEDYVKKIAAGAAKVNDPRAVSAYNLAMGGPQRTYAFARTFRKWGELDDNLTIPQILAKAYGDVEGAKIFKAGSSAVESSETRVSRTIPELSRSGPSGGATAAYVFVVRTEVEPSMGRTYRKYMDKLKAAEDKHDPSPVTRRVSVLGDAQVWSSIRSFNKWAERDALMSPGEAMTKAYGEAEAREIADMGASCIRNRTTYVLARRPDLSRSGTAPTTND